MFSGLALQGELDCRHDRILSASDAISRPWQCRFLSWTADGTACVSRLVLKTVIHRHEGGSINCLRVPSRGGSIKFRLASGGCQTLGVSVDWGVQRKDVHVYFSILRSTEVERTRLCQDTMKRRNI